MPHMSDTHQWVAEISGIPPPPPKIPLASGSWSKAFGATGE